jgi:4'-phosphopantetheinyl transferase
MTEIWLVDIGRSGPGLAELERDAPRLTPEDRRRANSLKDPRDRRERIATLTALRLLLERFTDPHAARQPFVAGPAGKPALADGNIQFSLSHVEGYALIGLTRSATIGVDLERERPLRLSARRREELIAAAKGLAGKPLPAASPDACFLLAWCRLEAFAKAHGGGIGRTLADLGLRSGAPRAPADIEAAAKRSAHEAGLIVRDLPLGGGLHAAVALEQAARLRPQTLPPDRIGLQRLLTAHLPSRRRAG